MRKLLVYVLTMALIITCGSFSIGEASEEETRVLTEYEGHTYQIVDWYELKWSEAQAICEEAGGHLVTITSAKEQAFIESLNEMSCNYWIGGFREVIGEWQWVTGETWEYDNWAEGEPNNSSNVVSNENCLTVWPYEWNDLNDDNIYEQNGFICEWDYIGDITPIESDDMSGTDPEEPVETKEPVESEEPVETKEPVRSEEPVDPEEPVETIEPIETKEPVVTENPGDIVETKEPEKTQEPIETVPVVTNPPTPTETTAPVTTVPPVEDEGDESEEDEDEEDDLEEDDDDDELEEGDTFEKGGFVYTLLNEKSVEVSAYTKSASTITIGKNVTYKSVKYKITGIEEDAFSDLDFVKKVTIGAEVKSIGKRAFAGCKKLKNIDVKSTKIVKVGKNALKGIADSAKITVPKKKYASYKALFKKKGQKKSVTIVKK